MIVEYNGHIIVMLFVSHEASLILILDPLYNRNFPFLSTVLKSSEVESGTFNIPFPYQGISRFPALQVEVPI